MAFEDFHPGGLLTSVVVGAADGFAASNDATNNRTGWKRLAFAVQALAFGGGIVAEFLGAPPMYSESAMGMGLGLAARAGTFKLTQSGQKTPIPVQGYREQIQAPVDNGVEQAYLQRQPAGILG